MFIEQNITIRLKRLFSKRIVGIFDVFGLNAFLNQTVFIDFGNFNTLYIQFYLGKFFFWNAIAILVSNEEAISYNGIWEKIICVFVFISHKSQNRFGLLGELNP